MKINHNYFAITSKVDLIKGFIRRGYIWAHLKDRVKWHIYPRLHIVPKFPTHIDIEIASLCNLRCPMCKSTNIREASGEFGGLMDFDLYKSIIDQCVEHGVYSIKLSWRGEPLLHPKVADFVLYAKRAGIKDVAFLTNGVLLTPEMSRSLWHSGLDWISISFDGFKEDYERIRYPAKFARVMYNVACLRDYRGENNKPQIRVQSIHSVIEGREKEFLQLWEGIADKVFFIPDQVRTLDEDDYNHDPTYECPNPWQRMVIASDGRVPMCITDYCCDTIIGDTNTERLIDIWHGDGFKLQRTLQRQGRRLENKPCRLCGTGAVMKDGKYV